MSKDKTIKKHFRFESSKGERWEMETEDTSEDSGSESDDSSSSSPASTGI